MESDRSSNLRNKDEEQEVELEGEEEKGSVEHHL
jgi:hypothetical protein